MSYGSATGGKWSETEDGGREFDLLAPGWYRMVVDATEDKTPSKGGDAVNVRLSIAPDWKSAGRVVFDYQCLDLPHSAKASEIGMAKHKSLCIAAGFDGFPTHHTALAGRAVDVLLKIERSADYGDKNRVVAYGSPSKGRAKDDETSRTSKPASPVYPPAAAAGAGAGGGPNEDIPFSRVDWI